MPSVGDESNAAWTGEMTLPSNGGGLPRELSISSPKSKEPM